MKYRSFGKTGDMVSVLGFGNMRLPVANGQYGKIDVSAAMKLVLRAIDGGVNYLDTSWPYHSDVFEGGDALVGGSSEPFVGEVIKKVGRDKIFVATKLPIWLVQERADMDKFLDAQLERLGTDYIDFYLVHNIIRATWDRMVALGLADFLDKAKKASKIRHAGFSFHDTPALYQEVLEYYPFAFSQLPINYYDTHFQAGLGLSRQAARRGMEPVMAGMLADRLPQKAKAEFEKTGIKRSPAGWALRWVWNQTQVSLALSGMHTIEQVDENLRLADESDIPLSYEELVAVDRVLAILHEKDGIGCSQCNHCSCPFGVAIKDNFTIYNAHQNLDVVTLSDKDYGLMLVAGGMDAAKCVNCGQCAYMCPQGLDIPGELRKVALYFKDKSSNFTWY